MRLRFNKKSFVCIFMKIVCLLSSFPGQTFQLTKIEAFVEHLQEKTKQ
jgi:hypothetical protein